MGSAPGQGAQLHDADEAGQVEHLPLEVVAVAHAAQVEQLGPCTRRALRWDDMGQKCLTDARCMHTLRFEGSAWR